ncbi:MAG: hypothetical protein GY953_10270 [bacterium]|nr:hypothetical protein [bacterium]
MKQERTRLWENQAKPKPADTELGRKIQEQTGAPSALVNHLVEDVAEQILESEGGEEGEPN